MSSINTVKNDLRGEFQADLKKLSSIQAELMTEQQRQIQLLKEELFNIKRLLMETNCTEVKECVAEDLTQINHKLIADDIKILQNEAAINQVILACYYLIEAMQDLIFCPSMMLCFTISDC